MAVGVAIADVISMVNFRAVPASLIDGVGARAERSLHAGNNKAKFLVAFATSVKRCRGRVAESTEGRLGYKGVGKELAGLLRLVNTAPLAEECLKNNTAHRCGLRISCP